MCVGASSGSGRGMGQAASLTGRPHVHRETDPNQHTLDTLEQAISILIERSSSSSSNGGGGGNDKASRGGEQRPQTNGMVRLCVLALLCSAINSAKLFVIRIYFVVLS